MAKNRIDRDELASKLVETATSAEDTLRAMAQWLTDFVMEAEERPRSERSRTSATAIPQHIAMDIESDAGTRDRGR